MYVYMCYARVSDILNECHGITSFSNCRTSCTRHMSSDNSGHLPCDFIAQFVCSNKDIFREIMR